MKINEKKFGRFGQKLYICSEFYITELNMPEISQFYGIVIMMYFDDHNPPHFHVRYNGNMAIINIKDGKLTGTLPRRAIKMVYDWLDLHQQELLDNWELLKAEKQPIKIEPLD